MPHPQSKKSIAIIGAGPVGIEAALYAKSAGYQVRILEKGEVAHNVQQWKHVTFFSPFGMNHSQLGEKLLTQQGIPLPGDEEYLSGRAYLERYLLPLANSQFLKPHIITGCEALAVSRRGILKNEHIGDGQRAHFPFRILTRDRQGREKIYESDYLIDASGSYGNPNWLGDGGIPAPGELANRERIQYGLEDIAGSAKSRYAGKTTLLVGDGHSAATSIVALAQLMEENPHTRATWITRGEGETPLLPIPGDPLKERERIVREANRLTAHPNVRRIKNAAVNALEYDERSEKFRVEADTPEGALLLEVDHIIANVGYSPDNDIYRELQVHECYASRAPMKLAAALLGQSSADCLTRPAPDAQVLRNPEPDFYIIGMKSYGKNSNFLLKTGFEQIRDVFRLISGDNALNLYRSEAAAVEE